MMNELQHRQDEHRDWNREHVHWLEDLTAWRAEREAALEWARGIELALRRPDEDWDPHQAVMVSLEQELARHQHHLEQYGEDDAEEIARHVRTRREQAEQRARHAVLKGRHEAIIKHLKALQELLK